MSKKRVATHNGVFHADEITAIVLLKLFTQDEIVVTRLPHNHKDFSQFDIVIDMAKKYDGIKFFDHHQNKGGASSAGLIWKALAQEKNYPTISKLISQVDKHDTGEQLSKEFEYANLIKYMNAVNIYSKEQQIQFEKALFFAQEILKALKQKEELLHKARKTLQQSSLFENMQGVVFLEEFVVFWQEVIEEFSSLKALAWYDKEQHNYKIRLTPKMVQKQPLHSSVFMEFVHPSGHFGVAKNKAALRRYLEEYFKGNKI